MIDIGTDIGEGDDIIEPSGDFGAAEPGDGGGDGNIFTACEFGIETGPQLQQGGQTPIHSHLAMARLQGAGDNLQQGRFTRTVSADDADGLPSPKLQIERAESVETIVRHRQAATKNQTQARPQ